LAIRASPQSRSIRSLGNRKNRSADSTRCSGIRCACAFNGRRKQEGVEDDSISLKAGNNSKHRVLSFRRRLANTDFSFVANAPHNYWQRMQRRRRFIRYERSGARVMYRCSLIPIVSRANLSRTDRAY